VEKSEKKSGLENVPAIRLIVSKCQSLGPGGSFHWNQLGAKGPYWRIYWNDTPGAFVSCGGIEVELTPEKIVALSPDAVYSTRAERIVKHFYVHCFVSQPFSEIKGRMFVLTNPELLRQASILAGKVNGRADEPRTQMELLVYLHSVLLAIPRESVPDCPAYSPKVAKAIEILGNIQKISNGELAKLVGMSRNGFLALFKKETKTSPQEYSRQFRLNEACVMLQHSDKSIDEIAQESGFCDRYYFSRAFRQEIGFPPGQFRARRYPNSGIVPEEACESIADVKKYGTLKNRIKK
jgi:AraC-like DNA-binding protein